MGERLTEQAWAEFPPALSFWGGSERRHGLQDCDRVVFCKVSTALLTIYYTKYILIKSEIGPQLAFLQWLSNSFVNFQYLYPASLH